MQALTESVPGNGMRNMMKALLYAPFPNDLLAKYQREGEFTKQMILQEELKTYPFGDVWIIFVRKQASDKRTGISS